MRFRSLLVSLWGGGGLLASFDKNAAAAAGARFRSRIYQRPNTKELLVRMRRGRRDRLLDTVEIFFLVMEYWNKTTVLIIKYCKRTVLITLERLRPT